MGLDLQAVFEFAQRIIPAVAAASNPRSEEYRGVAKPFRLGSFSGKAARLAYPT